MFRRVGLILALMMTSAAADDYRSYREAYAAIDWPNSITSAEQCQRRVDDVVRQFGFTDPEARMSRWTGDPALWVKDKVHHFDIVFSCGPAKGYSTSISTVGRGRLRRLVTCSTH